MLRRSIGVVLLFALAAAVPARSAFAQSGPPDAPPAPPPPDPGDAEPPAPDEEPPPDALAPGQAPSAGTFEQSLAPYGRWVMTPEYGRVWMPSGVGASWQPYTDGRWVFTGAGWSFSAAVPWGATYHYGRWGWRGGLGWFWVPGYVWGPAWVSWRTSPGYVGWAPLAPAGYVYPRRWPGWVAARGADLTLGVRVRLVPHARVGIVLRGARAGWAGAPVVLRPEYRARYRREHGLDRRRDHREEPHGRRG
jgi:hypothetical protein